jgi:peptidoglycan/xylan/chitin deacetylase (PgdA/CDA1 family)
MRQSILILLSCVTGIVCASDGSEYFSYCSNGKCALINGDAFHEARNMPVDLHVTCRNNRHYALTFDDGPGRHYPRLLEILKHNKVKATFFIVGDNLKNADAAAWFRAAVADGHYMANHTINHNDLTKLTDNEIVEAVEKSREMMLNALPANDPARSRVAVSSRIVRPPYGNIDMRVDAVLKAQGYTSVRWNADRYDWNMPGDDSASTTEILARVQLQLDFIALHVQSGDEFNQSILDLNHDTQNATIDAIESLINLVKSKGYEFVTMDICLGI